MTRKDMTVKKAVIMTILNHYPRCKNHLIAAAHSGHSLSGLQRLRELKKQYKIYYSFDCSKNEYDFSITPKEYIEHINRIVA